VFDCTSYLLLKASLIKIYLYTWSCKTLIIIIIIKGDNFGNAILFFKLKFSSLTCTKLYVQYVGTNLLVSSLKLFML